MLKRLDVSEVLAAEGHRDRNGRILRMALLVAGAVLVAAAIVWGWWLWQARTTHAYITDTVTRGDLVVSLVATGTLDPEQKVSVSSLVTGTISSVDVDYNEVVHNGQALAHLDPRDFAAKLTRAMAMVDAQMASRDAARTVVNDAEAALERTRELPQGQVVSPKDLELATTALARAKANLDAADAQVRAAQQDLIGAQSDLDKTVIVSPLDGVVLDVNAEVGQTVSAALLMTPLFTLANDLRRLELDVDIDEADVPDIKVGDPATFTVESAPDQPIKGSITQVRSSPTVSDGVTSYTAVIAVDNSSGQLKPGMSATAQVETDKAEGVLSVANSALRFAPGDAKPAAAGEQRVFVLRQGKLQPVTVTTGLTDGQRTAIVSGDLAPDDLVVTANKGH